MRRRLASLLPSLLLLASLLPGCSDDPGDNLIMAILGSVVAILLAASCGCSFYTAALVAGAINIKINRTTPTVRSKRWGWVYGVTNLLFAVGGVVLTVLIATNPDPEGETGADVYLYLVGGSLVAAAIGAAGLWVTAKAVPGTRPGALADDDEA